VKRENYQRTFTSLTLIEEKAVRLNEAVKEESVILGKAGGFQEVSEDVVIEFLKSHSMILMNEKLTGLDMRTCKEAQDNHDDDESVISEENTLTIKRFKRNLQGN
jgi:hypothetical protein